MTDSFQLFIVWLLTSWCLLLVMSWCSSTLIHLTCSNRACGGKSPHHVIHIHAIINFKTSLAKSLCDLVAFCGLGECHVLSLSFSLKQPF